MKLRLAFTIGLVLSAIVALLSPNFTSRRALAAGIVVNTSADEVVTNDGSCSLREAIGVIDGTADPDCGTGTTITFTVSTVNVDTFNNTSISIDNSVSINGGAGVIIDGGSVANSSTLFVITGTNLTLVSMNALTIRNFFSSGGAGAIRNDGSTLTVTGCVFSNNTAQGIGGAIINETSGILTATTSAFNGNSAGTDGGAIWNGGNDQLIITTTNFASNTANGSGGAIYNSGTIGTLLAGTAVSNFSTNTSEGAAANQGGGAIYDDAGGTLNMAAVSFNTNTALNGAGGAVFVNLSAGTVEIDDSAFVANVGQTDGGAVFAQSTATFLRDTFTLNVAPNQANTVGVKVSSGSSVTIANSTLTQNKNSDSSSATVLNESSGDVFMYNDTIHNNDLVGLDNGPTGTIQVGNTILDGNGGTTPGSNCAGTITSLGHNIDDGNTCAFAAAGDQPNTNPNLGGNPLGTYYPFQIAFLPNPGSPAIDKGDNTICANSAVQDVDQRAAAAFPTFTRPINVICDIGSIEAPFTPTATPTSTPTDTFTPTSTFTPSDTPTSTDTPSDTPTQTNTSTSTPTGSATATSTPTGSATFTLTNTATLTPTSTGSITATFTLTNTATLTPTSTGSVTATFTPSNTATLTPTSTGSITATFTLTNTPTLTPTSTGSITITFTPSQTLTPTLTSTGSVTVSPTHTPTVTGTLSVTPVPSNVPASPTPSILVADPVITKSVNVQLLRPGDTATFTLTVTNIGTAPATGVVVTDPLPALLQVVSTTESQGTVSVNGNTVTFTVGTVNPGQVVTLTIDARASPSAVPPANLVNIGTLSFNGGSPRSSSATVRLTAGTLPGTGEHPDSPQPIWPALLLAAALGIGLYGVYRVTRRHVGS